MSSYTYSEQHAIDQAHDEANLRHEMRRDAKARAEGKCTLPARFPVDGSTLPSPNGSYSFTGPCVLDAGHDGPHGLAVCS